MTKKATNNRMAMNKATRSIPNASIPNGTVVLNVNDGERGTIMNGFTWDRCTGEWTEYEVETAYGIEVWQRDDFVLMSEINASLIADGEEPTW